MGYQQHNPEYRRQIEDMMMLENFGRMIAQNPEMQKYFMDSPEGQKALEKMGLGSVDQLMAIGEGSGLPTMQEYKDLSTQIGDIDPAISYDPGAYGDLYGGQSYDPYQFSLRDISNVPSQVYDDVQKMQEESASRGFGDALAQLQRTMGGQTGLGPSGMMQASGTSLGRDYLSQLSNIGRDVSMQRAQEQLATQKLMQQMDFNRQMQQAGQRQFGANLGEQQRQFNTGFGERKAQFGEGQRQFGSQLQQYAKNFGLQKGQTQANLLGQRAGISQVPYQAGQHYYDVSAPLTGPKKKGFLDYVGAIGGAIGDIGGAVTGVGGLFGG